jgi:hypothetical protein
MGLKSARNILILINMGGGETEVLKFISGKGEETCLRKSHSKNGTRKWKLPR